MKTLAIIIIETEKGIAIALQINTVLNNSVDENNPNASHLEKIINIKEIDIDKIIPIFMEELIIPLISSFLFSWSAFSGGGRSMARTTPSTISSM